MEKIVYLEKRDQELAEPEPRTEEERDILEKAARYFAKESE